MNQVMRAADKLGIRNRFDVWSAIVAAVIAVPLVYIVSAIIDRTPPLTYIEARTVHDRVMAGQQLTVLFDVERTDICRLLSVNRYVSASDGREYAVTDYNLETATRPGRERYDRNISVPSNVPPGPAVYWIRLQYGCNWYQVLVHPLRIESPRVKFTVIPDPNAPYHLKPLPAP